ITPAQVNDGSDDACGIAGLELDVTAFDCNQVGDNTVTLTVTDQNGNSQSCTATVSVLEVTNPVAICQDITVELDPTGNITIDPEDVNNGSNDACGLASLEAEPTTFTCADVGPNTVTLTVTDNNGNSSS
ncbi:HYR domain-containing protein, partial [Arthrospira platensis SPKY1]|nr:HYR domain-containing protein [Arthrospira platensis SPKY1]